MAKILVVDDAALMQRILQQVLQTAGHQVLTASNGRECLDRVVSERPDLVVMDQVMPEMDGLAALRVLRAEAATQSLPVIMASALQDESDIRELEAAGASGFIGKPFQPAQILTEIARLLGG